MAAGLLRAIPLAARLVRPRTARIGDGARDHGSSTAPSAPVAFATSFAADIAGAEGSPKRNSVRANHAGGIGTLLQKARKSCTRGMSSGGSTRVTPYSSERSTTSSSTCC